LLKRPLIFHLFNLVLQFFKHVQFSPYVKLTLTCVRTVPRVMLLSPDSACFQLCSLIYNFIQFDPLFFFSEAIWSLSDQINN